MSYGTILAFVADINKYNIIRKKTLTCILSFKSKSKNCIATFSLDKEIFTEKQNLDDTNDLRFAVFYLKCFGWIWKRYNTILENMLFRYSGMYHRRRLENNNKIFLLFHITFFRTVMQNSRTSWSSDSASVLTHRKCNSCIGYYKINYSPFLL